MGILLYIIGAAVLVSLAACIASALGAAPALVNVAAGLLFASAAVATLATRGRASR